MILILLIILSRFFLGIIGWDLAEGSKIGSGRGQSLDWFDWFMFILCGMCGFAALIGCILSIWLEDDWPPKSFIWIICKTYRKNHPSKSEYVLRKLES